MAATSVDKVGFLFTRDALSVLAGLLQFEDVLGCPADIGQERRLLGMDWLEDAGYLVLDGQQHKVVASIAFLVHALVEGNHLLSLKTNQAEIRVLRHPLAYLLVDDRFVGRLRILPLPGKDETQAVLLESLEEKSPDEHLELIDKNGAVHLVVEDAKLFAQELQRLFKEEA